MALPGLFLKSVRQTAASLLEKGPWPGKGLEGVMTVNVALYRLNRICPGPTVLWVPHMHYGIWHMRRRMHTLKTHTQNKHINQCNFLKKSVPWAVKYLLWFRCHRLQLHKITSTGLL